MNIICNNVYKPHIPKVYAERFLGKVSYDLLKPFSVSGKERTPFFRAAPLLELFPDPNHTDETR